VLRPYAWKVGEAQEGDTMKILRREFLQLAAGSAALAALPRNAAALDYPTRPVRIVVGFPPGGGADIVSRLIGQWLSERLGQRFVVENRPGAGSNIGADAVVRSPPDGYTLYLVTLPTNAVNATLYSNLGFNFVRDIAPVAGLTKDPIIMEVTPSLPVKNVAEFVAYAKANPGRINMASSGIGSTQHIAGALFIAMTKISMNHVPYRGAAPALTDLMGGQVQVFFDVSTSSIEYIKAGKVRALAVTTARRWETLPDLPTVNDFVPGYEASNIRGVGAPRNTPMEIVEKLNKEINAALADPRIKAQLASLGDEVLSLSPSEFGKLIVDETEKWGSLARAANIKAE
jgi:tripartite-type tricarboxylate transporter receptor subunit TctC